jgi:hypothetical protein
MPHPESGKRFTRLSLDGQPHLRWLADADTFGSVPLALGTDPQGHGLLRLYIGPGVSGAAGCRFADVFAQAWELLPWTWPGPSCCPGRPPGSGTYPPGCRIRRSSR